MKLTRRDFMKAGFGTFTYLTTASTVPMWFAKSVHGLQGGFDSDRIFVLIQMGGGNDGLNTVIPYQDDLYMGDQNRPNLRIRDDYHEIDDLNALHPVLGNLAEWYFDGYMSIIQNVGYPNPNLSHFLSTSYWEYGASPGSDQQPTGQGWVSRFFDNECGGIPADQLDPMSMMAAGTSNTPEAMRGSSFYVPPRADDLDAFIIQGNERRADYIAALNNLSAPTEDLDFIQRIENVAEATVDAFGTADNIDDLRSYPRGRLGNGLRNISKVIRSGANTKIFYCSQGGYDTHSNQISGSSSFGQHRNLLSEFGQSVDAFLKDMQQVGRLNDVLMLTVSEFGRRVRENGSRGTDHGGANCMMAFGGGAEPGVFGGQPDLRQDSLIKGNLAHTIDFRSLYSLVMQEWFNGDPAAVFGTDFDDPLLDIRGGMELAPFINLSGSRTAPGAPSPLGCA